MASCMGIERYHIEAAWTWWHFVSREIAGLDALDEVEAVFFMRWNVPQHCIRRAAMRGAGLVHWC